LLLRTRCFRAFKISFVPKNPSCPKNSCFYFLTQTDNRKKLQKYQLKKVS
jgi:hypothetical protein